MKIYIKNMVCDRCKLAIKNQLNDLKLEPISVELGEVDFGETELTADQMKQIKTNIEPLGFELLDDKNSTLVEKIKTLIIELVHRNDEPIQIRLSDYIRNHLNYDYHYLSNLFSSIEGTTIEHYYIEQKIEKVKELLVYDELTLSEIAYQMGYSSVAHLSGQFKKITGLTPSHFKKLKDARQRTPLDKL
ncbi:AraC family transcriptional regulator [Prolixibacter sp. NT017]|uniref:helix-turn-helix domain-containing protein n=1 Tax=Prolixibacter sp. NT017 TaxID=2652390 RepID=UPI00127A1B64|nr:AraC family transcriptional regulator [Prolixibacter sp. NT017]GET24750.1 hypothetical protein NT017_10790 [Prolixibacter sp. NT017]